MVAENLFEALLGADPEGRVDPIKAARTAMSAPARKRFWSDVGLADGPEGYVLTLDGRSARTPRRRLLAVAQRPLAEALATEWRGLSDVVDPTRMPLTRLLNVAIDHVAEARDAVAADVVNYARSDLICYRAGEPQALATRQQALWNPILDWAESMLSARFILSQGLTFVAQPEPSVAAVARAVDALRDPVALTALHAATTLAGSALIALALAQGALDAEAAFAAAQLDEDYQREVWGQDSEAMAARQGRWQAFEAAARALKLSAG